MALEILGQGGGGGKSRLPLVLIGGAAIVALMLLRRSSASSPSAGAAGPSAEFLATAAAARGDMERLVAANDLERYRLDLAQRNTPAGLQSTFTGEQWRGLGSGVRRTILAQANRSGSLITAGPGGGIRITPTQRGIEGNLQAVQRSRSGLTSSSSYGIGAPAPQTSRPGLIDILQSYFAAAADVAKAGAYGGY